MSEPAEYLPPSINKNVNMNKSSFFPVFMTLKERFRESSHVGYTHVQTRKKEFTKEPPHQECPAFSHPFPNFPSLKKSLFWFQQWTFPLFQNHLCLTCTLLLVLSRSSEHVSYLRMGVLWEGISWSRIFKKVGVTRDGGYYALKASGSVFYYSSWKKRCLIAGSL